MILRIFEIIVNPTESELKLRPKVCKKTHYDWWKGRDQ